MRAIWTSADNPSWCPPLPQCLSTFCPIPGVSVPAKFPLFCRSLSVLSASFFHTEAKDSRQGGAAADPKGQQPSLQARPLARASKAPAKALASLGTRRRDEPVERLLFKHGAAQRALGYEMKILSGGRAVRGGQNKRSEKKKHEKTWTGTRRSAAAARTPKDCGR